MERTLLAPVPLTDPVQGVGVNARTLEMWASRALNIAYLPRCDNWHNPCLLSGSLSEAVYSCNPPAMPHPQCEVAEAAQSDCRPVWYWRVEPTFAAWCVRAIHRAESAKVAVAIVFNEALLIIQAEIESTGEKWEDVERMARGPPVKLPGSEILERLTNHARYSLCPKWSGWEKDAAKFDALEAAAVEAAEVERMRAGLNSAVSADPKSSGASRQPPAVVPPTVGHGPSRRLRATPRAVNANATPQGLFE